MYVQGGGHGLVLVRGGGNYYTAFVEAFPEGTFLRGQGATITDAETACWAKYQRMLQCPAAPEHGPFNPHTYDNGSGYCIRCGIWFGHEVVQGRWTTGAAPNDVA